MTAVKTEEQTEFGQKLITAIREISAEKPEHIYESPKDLTGKYDTSCIYVKKGEPDCIVGKALWKIGAIDASWETKKIRVQHEDGSFSDMEESFNSQPWSFIYRLFPTITKKERDWVHIVQMKQDAKHPWGNCVVMADEIARLRA